MQPDPDRARLQRQHLRCLLRIQFFHVMQYQNNPKDALANYVAALSLGGTRTLPELFETAGLKFDLSPDHIKKLMDFVHAQMEALLN